MNAKEISERLVRVARLPEALRPVPIYTGDPPEPILCQWLGVSRVNAGPPVCHETFILYFLDQDGGPRELLQYETLEIALDQARAICGYPQTRWNVCDIPVRVDGSYDAAVLDQAAPAR